MKKVFYSLIIASLLVACGGSKYSNDSAGLTQLAKDLDATSEMDIVKSLKPSLEDCNAIFNDEADAKTVKEGIDKQYEELEGMSESPISSKDGQTEVLIRKGVVGGDMNEISGGFSRISDKLKEGTEIYEFKYVEPGKSIGMKFAAFVFVNGSWKFFGKMYYAF